MLPFSLCNKKSLAIRHMNRLLIPTTLSIPSYDIGKYVGLRTYQLLLVIVVLRNFANAPKDTELGIIIQKSKKLF
jgi:hypothetical protein